MDAEGVFRQDLVVQGLATDLCDERGFALVDDVARNAQGDAVRDGKLLLPLAVQVLGHGVSRIEALEFAVAADAGRSADVAAVIQGGEFRRIARAIDRIIHRAPIPDDPRLHPRSSEHAIARQQHRARHRQRIQLLRRQEALAHLHDDERLAVLGRFDQRIARSLHVQLQRRVRQRGNGDGQIGPFQRDDLLDERSVKSLTEFIFGKMDVSGEVRVAQLRDQRQGAANLQRRTENLARQGRDVRDREAIGIAGAKADCAGQLQRLPGVEAAIDRDLRFLRPREAHIHQRARRRRRRECGRKRHLHAAAVHGKAEQQRAKRSHRRGDCRIMHSPH